MHVHALKWVAPHAFHCGTYFSFVGSTDSWKVGSDNCTSDRPAFLGRSRNSLKFFNLGSEADAAISVRFITYVDDTRGAAHLLSGIPGHFRGHAQRRFDGHSHLKRGR